MKSKQMTVSTVSSERIYIDFQSGCWIKINF